MTEESDQINIASDLWSAEKTKFQEIACLTISAARKELGLSADKSFFQAILANDSMLRSLNKDFRNIDKPTNVLSFPIGFLGVPGEEESLGEIYISFETVAREAKEQHKEFMHHFQHMVLHGFLHLLGYDHEEDAEADVMEAMEIRILEKLSIYNPYEEVSKAHG